MFMQLPLHAQQLEEIDSLKSELRGDVHDTLRALLLMEVSMRYQSIQPDSSLTYSITALELSRQIKYQRGEADALLHMGRLKRDGGNAAEALHQMFEALRIYREINDHVQVANSLNDISIIYANSGDFKKSLEYFLQALEIFRQRHDDRGISYALNNIGLVYQELGDEAKAVEYFLQSMEIKKKYKDLYGLSRGYMNLGSIAEGRAQWSEALYYFRKADSIAVVGHDMPAHASTSVALARIMAARGKPAEAIRYASLAQTLARQANVFSTELSATRILAAQEEIRGHYKEALQYQKQCKTLSDSLNARSNKQNLEGLKTKFNFEEQEREITLLKKDKELQRERLERRNLLTYSMGGGIILMLMLLGLLWFAYHTARTTRNSLALKNKEIELQKDDLDKLNKEKDRFFSILSHDLKGPLNSLRGFSYLVTEHLDKMTPQELQNMRTKIDASLDGLSELINNILEWSMTSSRKRKWIFDRIDTAELIRKNMALYQTMAESKNLSFVFQPRHDCFGYGDYYAIDTIVRNLLSNSIKFSHARKSVYISVTRENDMVLITVKDEGIGMPPDILDKLFSLNENVTQPGTNNEKGTGLGLTLCKELVKENRGDLRVTSEPGKGSEFVLYIPEFRYTRSETVEREMSRVN
jgi:signal transduction histidine kinase